MSGLDRRGALVGAAGITLGGIATARFGPEEMLLHDRRAARSHVAVLSATEYSEHIADSLMRAMRLFKINLCGKSVLLKPNLVEYIPGVEVNTNPILVGAAAETFLWLGAKRVVVGEGPGHQRDTCLVLVETPSVGAVSTCASSSQPLRASWKSSRSEARQRMRASGE